MNYHPINMGCFTVEVKIPNHYAPQNLQNEHWECNENTMITLGVSVSGRLSKKRIYLESRELAELFSDYLHQVFSKRVYYDECFIFINDLSSKSGKVMERQKVKHSNDVASKLNT